MVNRTKKDAGSLGVVLVADDTAVMRHACQRALERAGHKVILASNGEEAVAAARAENIDVALLDIKMPGLSGLDVLKTIKQERPLVEVIMMTAYTTQDAAEDATQFGASGFLTKPFSNIKTLTDAVAQAVIRKRLKEEGLEGPVRIEDLLLKEGLVSEDKLAEAKERAHELNISIRGALVRMGAVQAEDCDRIIAKALDIPFARLNEKDIDPATAGRIPAHVARKHRVMPILVKERAIHIAVDDPFNQKALDVVRRITGLEPVMVKGYGPEIDELIRRFYPQDDLEGKIAALIENADPDLLIELLESSQISKIEKVNFVEVAKEKGKRKWSFVLEGIISEEREK